VKEMEDRSRQVEVTKEANDAFEGLMASSVNSLVECKKISRNTARQMMLGAYDVTVNVSGSHTPPHVDEVNNDVPGLLVGVVSTGKGGLFYFRPWSVRVRHSCVLLSGSVAFPFGVFSCMPAAGLVALSVDVFFGFSGAGSGVLFSYPLARGLRPCRVDPSGKPHMYLPPELSVVERVRVCPCTVTLAETEVYNLPACTLWCCLPPVRSVGVGSSSHTPCNHVNRSTPVKRSTSPFSSQTRAKLSSGGLS
jgi:hypothetical protein